MLVNALLEAAFATGTLRIKKQSENSFALQADIGGVRMILAGVQLAPAESLPSDTKSEEPPATSQVLPFPGGAA